MKKVKIRHNSDTVLTGRHHNGSTLYFPPLVDTEVESEELADAIIYDHNAHLPAHRMEKVVEEVEDEVKPEEV